MKRLIIPYIKSLNGIKLEYAGEILENEGKREAVDKLNWAKAFPYRPITTFDIGYADDGIYIKYNVQGTMLRAIYENDQEPVYEDSCVEFFCKQPDSDYYMNFEFNCIGTCLAAKRKSRKEDVQRFSPDEMQLIERHSSLARRAFKEMEGMFTWDLVVKIPFSLLGFAEGEIPDKLLGNFYKCANGTESPHYLSWSPIQTENPNFHCPEFFGELWFEK
jgi:hypothetical protein